MNSREFWSRVLIILGGAAMALGAIDPLEGSVAIVPGSACFVLGSWIGQVERRILWYRLAVFGLIAFGVAYLWGISQVGGFGGRSGRSMWWGLLLLPYPIGWSLGMWGPGNPRWLVILGVALGTLYLALPLLVWLTPSRLPDRSMSALGYIGALGLLTVVGSLYRLKHLGAAPPRTAVPPSP